MLQAVYDGRLSPSKVMDDLFMLGRGKGRHGSRREAEGEVGQEERKRQQDEHEEAEEDVEVEEC